MNKKGHNFRHRETRPSGRQACIQERETRRGTMGQRGDKTFRKVAISSNKGKQEAVQWETKGGKTLGKAETPFNNGRQGDARPCRRQTRHPRKRHKKGHNFRHRETRPSGGQACIQEREINPALQANSSAKIRRYWFSVQCTFI